MYFFYFLFLTWCVYQLSAHQDLSKSVIIDEKKLIKGEQQLNISQDVNLDEQPMKKVISYMMKASSDRVINHFERMTLETKLIFLKSLNIRQYEWFLFGVSEEQWKDMWQRLPEEQKKVIPSTLEVQLKMICACWRACSSGDILWNPGKKKEAYVKDIPFFRNKALRALKNFKTDDLNDFNMDVKQEVFYKWLDNYFQMKKLELLHAL